MTIARRLLPVLFVLGLPAAASAQIADNCDASLWTHVYHPARLVQIHPCIHYVHDVEPGHGWMELHPVTLIEPN